MPAALAVALALVGYALISKRLATTPVSAAMVFMTLGVVLGPAVLGVMHGSSDRAVVAQVLEITLALVLFVDAMSISGGNWRVESRLPGRLLLIGMPLTMLLGALVARPLFGGDLDLFEAALLAICLAPTDAALGQAVVSNPRVPALIRGALNVESGLNDGLALPFFLLALAAAVEADTGAGQSVVEVFFRSLVLAAAVGVVLGVAGAWALARARRAGWITREWGQIAVLALIVAVYLAAVQQEGSGFIAAWVAGLAFGRVLGDGFPEVATLAEDLGALLGGVSFLGFGALLLGPLLGSFTWVDAVYAALSLTLIRLVPVAISMLGTGLARPTRWYVGWFGPRGLASIVFGLLLAEWSLPHGSVVVRTIYGTVALSVVVHGATAAWGSRRYAAWYARASSADPTIPEGTPVEEPAVRRRLLAPGGGAGVP
jgi:NhaP-type Na+/H+ or K+/H+ antiporter